MARRAIVLSDLASSAFYAGGIAEQAIGRSAPWFILAVMLFSFAVRSVYMESCGMFVRGGVYVVVRDAMGPFMARLSVSALLFDYILTGPISVRQRRASISARLINEISEMTAHRHSGSAELFRRGIRRSLVTAYFWWSNIKGIHESSGKALRIMQITTVMVVAFLIWCPLTIADSRAGADSARARCREPAVQPRRAWGGSTGTVWPQISAVGDHHRVRALAALDERI